MWPFRKKQTLGESGFFRGFTDWHCHILPGVDDGVQTMEEALQILAEYERLGVKEVWLTPHIMEDIPNTTEKLRDRFTELRTAYQGSVMLHLASEQRWKASVGGNKLFQSSDGFEQYSATNQGKRLLSDIGAP